LKIDINKNNGIVMNLMQAQISNRKALSNIRINTLNPIYRKFIFENKNNSFKAKKKELIKG